MEAKKKSMSLARRSEWFHRDNGHDTLHETSMIHNVHIPIRDLPLYGDETGYDLSTTWRM